MKNHYQTLNISRNASQIEIKSAYRKMALKYHPDRNPHKKAADFFRQVHDAYKVLSNLSKKNIYDQSIFNTRKEKKRAYANDNDKYRRKYYTKHDFNFYDFKTKSDYERNKLLYEKAIHRVFYHFFHTIFVAYFITFFFFLSQKIVVTHSLDLLITFFFNLFSIILSIFFYRFFFK